MPNATKTKNTSNNISVASLKQRTLSTKLAPSTPPLPTPLPHTNNNIKQLPPHYIEFLAFIPIRWHIIYALSRTDIFPSGYSGTSREIIDVLYQHKKFLTINFANMVAPDFEHNVREALQYLSSGNCNKLARRTLTKSPYNGSKKGNKCTVLYTFN